MDRATPALLNPDLRAGDAQAARWLTQVTLRLRREIAWCRHRDGSAAGAAAPADPAQDSLDLLRFHDAKLAFFADDVTARWLGERIAEAAAAPVASGSAPGSRWQRAVDELGLDPAACFVLACALAARADAAFGAVAAQALDDASKPFPTLALAQRLWDDPLAILACADAAHPLYRSGLIIAPAVRDGGEWGAPLQMPAAVARALLADPRETALPAVLRPLSESGRDDVTVPALAHWLRATPVAAMQVVPVQGPRGGDIAGTVGRVAAAAGSRVVALDADILPQHPALTGIAATAWLHGVEVLAPESWIDASAHAHGGDELGAIAGIALRWYVPVEEGAAPRAWPAALVAPVCVVPSLSMAERATRLAAVAAEGLPARERKGARGLGAEAARRFRVQERSLGRIERAMRVDTGSGARPDLFELARAEAATDMAQLAAPVEPRFELAQLILPPRETRALGAIVTAMRTLGRVHYEWGAARAWNEGGLAVMFCGPPGTGKTMAAEALASELALPMYRIDLSQVVNKYIGETEKNLRRIFDAAEAADCLLFFDEADALFGKRTEVRDAHDRFANIEISYLLERMERFKGLAVLATNRRKDLDEAFMRRLRYVVEFPMPGVAERAAIWRQVFPAAVDTSAVDVDFLARRFEVAGGAIRSAAFNACLQAAAHGGKPAVAMTDVVQAVKSELEKGGREVAGEQFGAYAHLLGDAA
ncbi:MAG: ATP-binding protein [Caldimonas sp.]